MQNCVWQKKFKELVALRNKFDNRTYYSYGSEAFNYDFENNFDYVGEKKSFQRTSKNKLQKSKSIPALIILLSLVFVGSLVSLCSFCLVNCKANSISILQEKLKSIKADNVTLEEEISKRFDLDKTEKIAQTKLGMHKPLPYQIVHIERPKQNYVIRYM